jgi:hypothetical protein
VRNRRDRGQVIPPTSNALQRGLYSNSGLVQGEGFDNRVITVNADRQVKLRQSSSPSLLPIPFANGHHKVKVLPVRRMRYITFT